MESEVIENKRKIAPLESVILLLEIVVNNQDPVPAAWNVLADVSFFLYSFFAKQASGGE
ncbi:hypothetical protein IIE45_004626 [Salmonella enterica]|nr:hypothetical protein [Salmonella enterica]